MTISMFTAEIVLYIFIVLLLNFVDTCLRIYYKRTPNIHVLIDCIFFPITIFIVALKMIKNIIKWLCGFVR